MESVAEELKILATCNGKKPFLEPTKLPSIYGTIQDALVALTTGVDKATWVNVAIACNISKWKKGYIPEKSKPLDKIPFDTFVKVMQAALDAHRSGKNLTNFINFWNSAKSRWYRKKFKVFMSRMFKKEILAETSQMKTVYDKTPWKTFVTFEIFLVLHFNVKEGDFGLLGTHLTKKAIEDSWAADTTMKKVYFEAFLGSLKVLFLVRNDVKGMLTNASPTLLKFLRRSLLPKDTQDLQELKDQSKPYSQHNDLSIYVNDVLETLFGKEKKKLEKPTTNVSEELA